MENTTWKILAIIFIVLFVIENLFFIFMVNIVLNDEEKVNECYYNICGEYPEADYEDKVCSCYDYDNLGNLIIAKTEYLK